MTNLRETFTACWLAALLLAAPAAAQESVQEAVQKRLQEAAPAPEMKSPHVIALEVDWDAARAALAGLDRPPPRDEAAAADAPDALARLNAVTGKMLANIAASGVPVLLPLDTAALLRDQAQGSAGDGSKYLADFHAPTFFYPGPSGYDAAFGVEPKDAAGRELSFVRPVEVQISASTVIYELDGPAIDQGSPVPALEPEFPGIRRVPLESRLRYTFTRFGVPYFVSILCFDGPTRARRLSCREADQIALRFVKALHLVGGAPPTAPAPAAPPVIERPQQISSDFTYYAPGDILPGTGMQGHSGRADATVYSSIHFPIAHAPAYTNSQSFMNWGNCDLTGLVRLGGRGKDEAYRCRVNELRLFNDETRNYAYPWRDNFCEHRYYDVTQCPGGLGHQGEDIRPSSCKLRNEDADRCEPYQDEVVAARDGVALRAPGDEALYLVVDAPGEHIRFRYLHMNPHMLDLAGMVSGRALTAGELLGPVGDYGAREGGTSYHLHFNVQVPTRQGWLFVNPYMTLVAAYERLIGARGQVVNGVALAGSAPAPSTDATPVPNPSVPSPPSAADAMVQGKSEPKSAPESETRSDHKQGEHETVAQHCTTRFLQGHRRRLCRADAAENRGRPRHAHPHAHAVRAVDRRVPLKSDRPRHRTGDLHARHERG
jgi:hypothetical protein